MALGLPTLLGFRGWGQCGTMQPNPLARLEGVPLRPVQGEGTWLGKGGADSGPAAGCTVCRFHRRCGVLEGAWDSVGGTLPSVLVAWSGLPAGPRRAFAARVGRMLSFQALAQSTLNRWETEAQWGAQSYPETKAVPGLFVPGQISGHGPGIFLGWEAFPPVLAG